jgi:hypothetical protein
VFRLFTDTSTIPFFNDLKEIDSLEAQPLYYGTSLWEQFRESGRRFVELKGRHYLKYEGSIILGGRSHFPPFEMKFFHYPVPSHRYTFAVVHLIEGFREGHGGLLLLQQNGSRGDLLCIKPGPYIG